MVKYFFTKNKHTYQKLYNTSSTK
ncbi:hypothetical protein ACVQ9Z_13490 [Staphylococcus aureus]